MHTKNTYIAHPLRDIILHFDPAVQPPAFETEALQYYQEIHDRTWAILQRIRQARAAAAPFHFRIDDLEQLYEEAYEKFDHLTVMSAQNLQKERVREQLRTALARIDKDILDFVPKLLDETQAFYEYDGKYIFEQDKWMDEEAFPRFDKVFADYQSCSVDMMDFDMDLDDFKGSLRYVKRLEAKYYDEMNVLMDRYDALHQRIQDLTERVFEFDEELV